MKDTKGEKIGSSDEPCLFTNFFVSSDDILQNFGNYSYEQPRAKDS